MTRGEFESICSPVFDRIMVPVEDALFKAQLTREQIDEVVMVGGSTRIPIVR